MDDTSKKKKVLVVVPDFPRLTETFIERDISKLATYETLSIEVFALKKSNGFVSDNIANKISYSRMTYRDLAVGFVKYFLLKPQITLTCLKHILRKDVFDTNSLSHNLGLFVKGFAYAVVFEKFETAEFHAHFMNEFSSVCLIAAMYLGKPCSLNIHAKDIFVTPSLPQFKLSHVKFTTVCNKYAYAKCLEICPQAKDKVHLIYHGLDEERLIPKSAYILKPANPLIFVNVSRFVEKKGLEYFLQACKLLAKESISFEAAIVGANDASVSVDMYSKYIDEIKEAGLSDMIKIYGEGKGVAFEEVKQFYRIADIFVQPSISSEGSDSDGVPNAVIEAALSKLPIIATDAGSITDFLNVYNALLIPQRDAVSIAQSIKKLLADSSLRQAIGKRAYFDAKEMFSSSKNVLLLHNLLLK
jgi:glycosyltransferase involved in cell wall biosynthesis